METRLGVQASVSYFLRISLLCIFALAAVSGYTNGTPRKAFVDLTLIHGTGSLPMPGAVVLVDNGCIVEVGVGMWKEGDKADVYRAREGGYLGIAFPEKMQPRPSSKEFCAVVRQDNPKIENRGLQQQLSR